MSSFVAVGDSVERLCVVLAGNPIIWIKELGENDGHKIPNKC